MNPAAKSPDESTYSGRFAARLRSLREKAGLSVDETVAALAENGVKASTKTVYNWEQGTREPPLDTVAALAGVYKLKTVRAIFPER